MESKSVDGRFVQTPNERRIIELLKRRMGRKASAAELAKHVGFPTKKGVNPLLYDMQKRGVIRRVQESPPLWQLIVTATNSGPGGYLQAGGGGAGPRGNKPLSPAALLRGTEDSQFHAPGPGEHPHPWKRPRFDTNTSVGSTSGIPSLLDLEPGQIGPNTMNYNSSMQQYPRKGSKTESVRTILTNLNAQRKGRSAQAHASSGTGSDFKPPPSPMEMLHGGAAGAAGYQTTVSSSPFTSSVVPSSKFSAASLSNHTHNVAKRAPPGGGSGAGGSSGIASWLSTPTRPSWMKSTPASAEATGTSLNSNRPAAPNASSLTSQGVQNNTTAPQRVSPTPPRQNTKKFQSVNSLLKQINANRKGAYSPQPGAAAPTTSTSAGNEKFVPPPSPAELLSQAGAPQLTAPPTAQPPIGRFSPNMMAQQPPSVGNGRGALLAGLQSSHGNSGRPPGGGSIGLGVGLTTAGIKGSDASAKFAGNFLPEYFAFWICHFYFIKQHDLLF